MRVAGFLRFIIGPGLALAAACVHADDGASRLGDLSIEQLMDLRVEKVYSASKYEQSVTQAPASVSIVSADDIRKFGYRTLAEILRSIRGVYVSDDRNYSYVGVRGFLRPGDYNSRVLVLIDGHRMNDNIYDGAYVGGEAVIDVNLIERVEFIRGPSSSIYGSSAFFGVINVITKSADKLDGTRVSAGAGSFGTYRESVTHGMRFGADRDAYVSTMFTRSAGERNIYYPEFDQRISSDPRASDDGVARNTDGEKAFALSGRVHVGDFSLSGWLTSRNKQVPTASFGGMFNGGEQTTDRRSFFDLKYEHALSADWRVAARAFYGYWAYNGDYPSNYAAPGDPPQRVVFKDEAEGAWAGTEWQFTGRLFDRHTIVLGTEYRENLKAHQWNYDETSLPSFYLDDDRRSRTLAFYAQGDFKLSERLRLNAGVRLDHYPQSFGTTTNPRLGLIYAAQEGTTFKALYGQAFRAPNLYEQRYYSAQGERPRLSPEKIRTYELVAEHYFDRRHRATLSAYRYDIRQLISQRATDDGSIYFDNADSTRATGLEFEVEGKYDSGVHGWASYALQRTRDAEGHELGNSPRHLAKLDLQVPMLGERLSSALELQYHGAIRTLSGARYGSFVIVNLNLVSHPFDDRFEISAGVQNLLDRRYGYAGAEEFAQDVVLQYGRNLRADVSYRFGGAVK